MDIDEQRSVALVDGSGRPWVFSGPAGPAEHWLRRVATPERSAAGRTTVRESGVPLSLPLSAFESAAGRINDVTEVIRAMDRVRSRQTGQVDSFPADFVDTDCRLLAS